MVQTLVCDASLLKEFKFQILGMEIGKEVSMLKRKEVVSYGLIKWKRIKNKPIFLG